MFDSPEDFKVKEIIDRKFFRKFSRKSGKVEKSEGNHTLYLLKKRNFTTIDAINIIRKKFRIKKSSIGYAGLKDKFAVTEQYLTIKDFEKEIDEPVELKYIAKSENKISIGNLIGNEFELRLKLSKREIENYKKLCKEGFKNYFGPQRFGTNQKNHIIGKYILRKDFEKAEQMIKKYCYNIGTLQDLDKRTIKFFINSYQSHIFNIMLKSTKTRKILDMPGYKGKQNLLTKKDKITPKDFRINELKITCKGGKRASWVFPERCSFEKDKKTLLKFFLPKGSYATTLIAAIKE